MKNKKVLLILIIIFTIIVIDQISKILIINLDKEKIEFGFFAVEKTTNEGMAFGFNTGNTKNIFMTIFVICIIINF